MKIVNKRKESKLKLKKQIESMIMDIKKIREKKNRKNKKKKIKRLKAIHKGMYHFNITKSQQKRKL